jgi:hypothetical protein
MRRGRSDALYLSSRSSLTDAESISVKKCTIEFSTKVYIAMCFDVNDQSGGLRPSPRPTTPREDARKKSKEAIKSQRLKSGDASELSDSRPGR